MNEDKVSFQRWMGISEFVLFLLFEIFNFIFMHMCSLHICLCTTPVHGAHEGQLRTLGPLALELRVFVNVSVGPGN